MGKSSKVDSIVEDSYNNSDEDFLSTSSEPEGSAPPSGKADVRRESSVKGSKSWKKDDWNENPWGQQNLLKAELKDKSFVLHWVRDGGSHGNVDRYLEQGYEFVTYGELANYNKERLRNGRAIDSVVRVVEMVLMKLPRVRNEAKKQWLKKQQVSASQSQQEFRSSADAAGVRVLEEAEARDLPSAYPQ